jgi:hypothetical protein
MAGKNNADKKIFKNIHQIGIVTKDARKTIKKYIYNYGIGPWNLWEFGPEMVEDMQVKGKRMDYRMIVATCKKMNIDFEIIEPLDKISIYYDFLKEKGEGIQHINYDVFDYDNALSFLKDKDVGVTQFGNLVGKHRYIYFDSEYDAGHTIETSGNLPGLKRREPEETFAVDKLSNNSGFKKIKQVGILIFDIERTVKKLNDRYTIGPWELYDRGYSIKGYNNMNDEYFTEQRIATCSIDDVELVLIQPEDNSGILADAIKKGGQGPYFVSFEVDDYKKALNSAVEAGIMIIQDGNWQGRRFSFLNTKKDLKFITCIIENGQEFKKSVPYRKYPNE